MPATIMILSLVLPTVAKVQSSLFSRSLCPCNCQSSWANHSRRETTAFLAIASPGDRLISSQKRKTCGNPSWASSHFSNAGRLYSSNANDTKDYNPNSLSLSGYERPKVNWYPGHIAKAERQLSETLKSVDVVIEVRDARAPKATAHPKVGKWAAGRPRVVVLTRVDMVASKSRESWREAYRRFGADQWEERLDGEGLNRNMQMRREQSKYDNSGETESVDSREEGVEEVLFVDAKRGQGTHAISRAVYRAGRHVNERRNRRGLNDRALRVGIIGFPNVGKVSYFRLVHGMDHVLQDRILDLMSFFANFPQSALINRLLGRKRARTANTPGITRSLQWIRVANEKSISASGASGKKGGNNTRKKGFELLDSPGIIPSDLLDQNDALLLAACNSVGVGAYDNQAVAAYLCDRIQSLVLMKKDYLAAPLWRQKCIERYGFDPVLPLSEQNIAARWGSDGSTGTASNWIAYGVANQDRIPTGEDMLFIVADKTCNGDPENAARKILQDFRTGRMGSVALQLAPESEGDDGETFVDTNREDGLDMRVLASPTGARRAAEKQERKAREEIEQRSEAAIIAAKEKGLELPPLVETVANERVSDEIETTQKPSESEVGKGLFDGW